MPASGLDAALSPGGPNEFTDQGGNDGTLALGWGSGTANFTYLISVRISHTIPPLIDKI